jgi:hypothetical protein
MSVLYQLSSAYRLDYKYNTCYTIFRWSLSAYIVWLRVLVIQPMGSTINVNRSTINAHQFNNQLDHRSITKPQMSAPRFEPGSFMTERERSTN